MTTVRKQSAAAMVEGEGSSEWVSLPVAAQLIGKNREVVLQLALKGQLMVEHRGRWTFVSRASVEAFLARSAKVEE